MEERLLKLAEDELAEYSTRQRKFEKMRPKVVALLSANERTTLKQELRQQLSQGGMIAQVVERQRQTVALPFWGIAGLGLLAFFLGSRPALVLAAVAVAGAFTLQRWGWKLQARRLLLDCIEDLEQRQAQSR
ncbi:hypothetical protein [Anthocerotibacter panamensis]|uniref:hypothetical protein n=1 Tax=Anthocerotibacter panamensis TaxID=2857077 RepID=UPI001FDA058A|nr:hypothetical protein [Anthocerotibacter panamensis]